MSILYDKEAWKLNPWYQEHGPEYHDHTGFYIGISICTILGLSIIILNIVFCCCSPYKHYWRDPNTGNRFALPLWIQSPHKTAPLTLQPEISQLDLPPEAFKYNMEEYEEEDETY